MRVIALVFLLSYSIVTYAQEKQELSVAKIMQDPKSWVGTSPRNPYWSEDSKTIYFNWNPDKNPGDSLYKVSAPWTTPEKVTQTELRNLPSRSGSYNKDRTKKNCM